MFFYLHPQGTWPASKELVLLEGLLVIRWDVLWYLQAREARFENSGESLLVAPEFPVELRCVQVQLPEICLVEQ